MTSVPALLLASVVFPLEWRSAVNLEAELRLIIKFLFMEEQLELLVRDLSKHLKRYLMMVCSGHMVCKYTGHMSGIGIRLRRVHTKPHPPRVQTNPSRRKWVRRSAAAAPFVACLHATSFNSGAHRVHKKPCTYHIHTKSPIRDWGMGFQPPPSLLARLYAVRCIHDRECMHAFANNHLSKRHELIYR